MKGWVKKGAALDRKRTVVRCVTTAKVKVREHDRR